MVYVLDTDGRPLMPTNRHGKVRHLLNDGKAVVVRRTPFTIRLLYETPGRTQPVSLGVDAGAVHVGLSACTDRKELFSAECELRTDINQNLEQRRRLRRSRRNRKTRYRKPRFLNRTHGHNKPEKKLAPSVRERCGSHVTLVRKVMRILPVTGITIEMAPFDTQKLKARLAKKNAPKGTGYQHGEAEGYDNVKAYVKWRDGGKCRICGSHTDLQIHHRLQRKDGGSNRPDNLICVCGKCHRAFHAGLMDEKTTKLMLPGKAPKALSSAAFMGIMRWAVWDGLKTLGLPLHMSFGYITAEQRKKFHVWKSHRADARCISGHGDVPPVDECFQIRKVRCHNRQIHRLTVQKGGVRRNNQAPYEVKGFRLFDKVELAGCTGFIFGRRADGRFAVRTLSGVKLNEQAACGKLRLLESARHYLIERRRPLLSEASLGVPAAK